MATGLIELIKRASMDAVNNSKPCDLRYGTVISTTPLKVRITQQFIIPESMLIVPEHLTEYELDVSILPKYGWKTQDKSGGTDEFAFESHNHNIVIDKKKMLIHAQLKVDDKVVLLRQQGGQSYLILDRLPKE